jgi:hypothetical protein
VSAKLPKATPRYRLVQAHCADLRNDWEEHCKDSCDASRLFTDKAVGGCPARGILENGFARLRCGASRAESLFAFSCRGRGLTPSCGAEAVLIAGHGGWTRSVALPHSALKKSPTGVSG